MQEEYEREAEQAEPSEGNKEGANQREGQKDFQQGT